jgi:hypothetical protein
MEVSNTTRQAVNSTQQETYRDSLETNNNKKLNYQNSFVRNAIFRALSQRDQLTTNNQPLPVLSNRLVPK